MSIEIKKEISPVISEVQNMSIASSSDMSQATSTLSQLNRFLDAMTEEKEKLTKPLNEALSEIRSRYKPTELLVQEAIKVLKGKMSQYQTLALEEQKKQTEVIANKVMEGKLKVETGIKKISELDTPEEKIKTSDGAISFRTVKKFEVMDLTMLPYEYLLANESAIRKAMIEGRELPGVRYYEEQSVINRRN